MYLAIRFLHVASAIVLVGGVIARQLTRSLAERSEDPKAIALIFRAADPIERYMVIPGSILVIVFGVFLALVVGAPIFGFLQGASRNWLLVANLVIISFLILVRRSSFRGARSLPATSTWPFSAERSPRSYGPP